MKNRSGMHSIIKIVKTAIKAIIIIALILAFTIIYQCRNAPKTFLIGNLPKNTKIENLYIEKPAFNGDYLVLAKFHITEAEFHEFTKVLNLESSSGKKPHILFQEFPLVEWWVAPEFPDDIFYKSGESFETWSFYKNGFGYYCDAGW